MTGESKDTTKTPLYSTKQGARNPNLLRHYREQVQGEQADLGHTFHTGSLEARADIGHEYWMATERGEREIPLNTQRGICMALQKYSPLLAHNTVDELVGMVFTQPMLAAKRELAAPPAGDASETIPSGDIPVEPEPVEPEEPDPPVPPPATTVSPPQIGGDE